MPYLEYVEATGAQWIALGFTPTGDYSLEYDWEPTSVASTGALFCARGDSFANPYAMFMIVSSGAASYRHDNNGNTSITQVTPTVGVRHLIRREPGKLTINGTEITVSTADFTAGGPMYLLGSNATADGTPNTNYLRGKVYGVRVWDADGTLIRDLSPYRDDLGQVGLLDAVSGTHYISESGTSLTAGPAYLTVVYVAGAEAVATVQALEGDLLAPPAVPSGYWKWAYDFTVPISEDMTISAIREVPSQPIPMLMGKVWDGDDGERFTFMDMRRVEYNANMCARYAEVPETVFDDVDHASQFDYSEAERLETLIDATADALGLTPTASDTWGPNRTLSFADFERWESSLWVNYAELGGVGDRIPAGTRLIVVSATLFADDWKGDYPPFTYDITVPSVFEDNDSIFFVHHTATYWQRVVEMNAELRAETLGPRQVRIIALNRKPTLNLPIRIAMEGLRMQDIIELPVSGWTGTGPWTQTVTLANAPTDAILGIHEGMTDDQVRELIRCAISPSAVSGTSLTVRAMLKKPDIDLAVGLLYNAADME